MTTVNSPSKSGKGKQTPLVKANWDDNNTEIFVNLCVDEIVVNRNKPGLHINKRGWDNIIAGFKNVSGVEYTKTQLKNRWDRLRQEWGWWKDLIRGESGLGRNVDTGAIEQSDEWWKNKLERYPNSIKFRYKPLALEDKLDILFNEKAATGEFQYTSSSGKMPTTDDFIDCYTPIGDSDGEGNPTEGDDVVIVDPKDLGKRKVSSYSGQKPKKLNGAARLSRSLDRIVEAVSSSGTTQNTPPPNDGIPTIKECINYLSTMHSAVDDHDFFVWATKLFNNPNNRQSFMAFPNDELRIKWAALEIQLEKAKFQRAMTGPWNGSPTY